MEILKRRLHAQLLATTIFASAAVTAPAFAQGQQPGPQTGPVEALQPEDGDAVVATGSRLASTSFEPVSAVTTVDGEEARLQGTIRAEDLLNSLPQVFAGQGGFISNGATGTATADLRGLGSRRTLVLINGRRLAAGDAAFPAADLNFIPILMVDRVDLLTGGASSVYGADAVAGAINFVMDTDLQGIRADAQYSFFYHDNDGDRGLTEAYNRRGYPFPTGTPRDGKSYNANLALGTSFADDRGHVTLYGGYRRIEGVNWEARDYSACGAVARTQAQVQAEPARLVDCGGSVTSANGTFVVNDASTSTFFQIGPNRTLIPGVTFYNFAPGNHLQRPDERYTAGGFAHYEISPALRPYLEVMFMDDVTTARIAPSGDFGNTFSINCGAPGAPRSNSPGVGNPLLSAQQRNILCDDENLLINDNGTVDNDPPFTPPRVFVDPTTGLPYTRGFAQILRRNVEGGNRTTELEHTSYRGVAGLRGDLSDVWSYDVYYQYGRTDYKMTYLNDFSVTRLARAIDVIDDPRTMGVDPICRSVLSGTDPNCVPWDIFATGQVSQAALNYLQVPGFERGRNSQTVFNATFTGNLGPWGMSMPWAGNPVAVALGVEYRRESLDFDTSALFQVLPSTDYAGVAEPVLPISGEYDVREAFAEVRIPIVEQDFFHELSLELGYRYSDYDFGSRGDSTGTYKLGVNFAPVQDIRFRASYNRAVRAPNIQELFEPQRVTINGNGDPCAGAAPSAPLAACQAMGVTAAQYGTIAPNPAGQYNGLIGGNPDLNPEEADTFTLGVVVQPRSIPNLAISVDYFDIDVDSTIRQIGQDAILATCVSTRDPFFCGLVQRNPAGSLWQTNQGFVRDLAQNIGSITTRGIDVGASYSMRLGNSGSLGFSLLGTRVLALESDDGISEPFDCDGHFGLVCGTPIPEWRHRARITYSGPHGLGASVQWRYFSGVDLDNRSNSASLNFPFAPFNARIPSQSYFDLTVMARLLGHYTLRAGVNNIFDRSPPILGGSETISRVTNACEAPLCNGNTFPNVYDGLGRYIFAGVTVDF